MQRAGRLHRTLPASLHQDLQGISLWKLLERSARPLGRIAGCWPIEIHYGEAAAVNFGIADEIVERILFNLVRDAVAALDSFQAVMASGGRYTVQPAQLRPLRRDCDFAQGDHANDQLDLAGTIRINAGMLTSRIGSARPWPFRRIQLSVEDTGCGIDPELLQRVVQGAATQSQCAQRLGLCGAQPLVLASGGELLAESSPGHGTCVQISWPVAPLVREVTSCGSPAPMEIAGHRFFDAEQTRVTSMGGK